VICSVFVLVRCFFFFQAEDGIRDLVRSRGLGDVYKRQLLTRLRDSDQVAQCMAVQTFRFATGRPPQAFDGCVLTEMMSSAGAGAEINLSTLLDSYPLTTAFRTREVTP